MWRKFFPEGLNEFPLFAVSGDWVGRGIGDDSRHALFLLLPLPQGSSDEGLGYWENELTNPWDSNPPGPLSAIVKRRETGCL